MLTAITTTVELGAGDAFSACAIVLLPLAAWTSWSGHDHTVRLPAGAFGYSYRMRV